MSLPQSKAQQDAESNYKKAIEAELDGHFDLAFRLYLDAAKSHIALANNASTENERVKLRNDAKRCLERAEKIKAAKKDAIKPIIRDQFADDEQERIIQRSNLVNGSRYELWNDQAEEPQRVPSSSQSRTQPDLGEILSSQSPQWRRPQELFGESQIALASTSLDPKQILQNVITDCSLCSSIVIALRHHIKFGSKLCLSCLFPQDVNGYPRFSDTGHYAVRMHVNGALRKIPMDDYLPFYSDGRPICISTTPYFDLWPGLIEKAYLKFAGGYDFPGSNSSIDLHMLTGWIPEHIDLKRNTEVDHRKTWDRILSGYQKGLCVLTVGTGLSESPEIDGVKLLKTHSYAVLDVQEDDDDRWLSIYNPIINPDASRNSPSATNEGDIDLAQLNLEDSQGSDVLQVRLRDLRSAFETLYISWNPSIFSQTLEFHGSWKPKSATVKHPQCVHHRLRLNAAGAQAGDEIWILLIRHFIDRKRKTQFISIHAQQEDVLHDSRTDAQTALKGSYINSTHVLTRLTLEKPIGHVSLFASYDGDYEDVFFTVQVFSSASLSWMRETPKHTYTQTVEGTFTSKNSGGNSTYPTFMNNPQSYLRLRKGDLPTSAKADVRLVVEGPRDVPLNVLLVRSANGERVTNLLPGGIVANSGAYGYGIAQAVAGIKAGDYAVVISAFEPRYRGAYSLRLESSSKVDISPIPMEGAGMFCKTLRGQWDPGNDGGSPRFGRYEVNPKFEIEVSSSTSLKARLQLSGPSHILAINVGIFASLPGHNLGRQITTSGPYEDHTTGVITPSVTLDPGKYIAVCSTYDPDMHAEFILLLYSKAVELRVTRL